MLYETTRAIYGGFKNRAYFWKFKLEWDPYQKMCYVPSAFYIVKEQYKPGGILQEKPGTTQHKQKC